MTDVRIGISGWRYKPWRGTFYPKGLTQARELEYAAARLNSIEINGSFYALQRPESYRRWARETPDDFVFSVKGGRFITHLKKLVDVETPLANFFASGLLALGPKLGPVLWQLPPTLGFGAARMDDFLGRLPRTTGAAAELAAGHDARLDDRAHTTTDADRPLRHAVEVRHPSFRCAEFVALLRAHGVALVVADTAQRFPFFDDLTAGFVYVRLHGDEELYVSGYSDAALDGWAARIREWTAGRTPVTEHTIAPEAEPEPQPATVAGRSPGPEPGPTGPGPASDLALAATGGRDVYVYFDNDVKTRAPFDAIALAERLRPAAAAPAPGSSGAQSSPKPEASASSTSVGE